MCIENLGALIFFADPLSAHPHQADIDSLVRLSNCGNVIVCADPTSATLKGALEGGSHGLIPSFFETVESPVVAEYKAQQELALARAVMGGEAGRVVTGMPMLDTDPCIYFATQDSVPRDEDISDKDNEEDASELLYQVKVLQAKNIQLVDELSFSEAVKEKNLVSNLYGMKKKKGSIKMMKTVRKSMRKIGFH